MKRGRDRCHVTTMPTVFRITEGGYARLWELEACDPDALTEEERVEAAVLRALADTEL